MVIEKPPGRSDLPIYSDIPDNLTVDGAPAFAADALVIEFSKDSFDR